MGQPFFVWKLVKTLLVSFIYVNTVPSSTHLHLRFHETMRTLCGALSSTPASEQTAIGEQTEG